LSVIPHHGKGSEGQTFSCIPSEVTQAVERVESERCGKDRLLNDLDPFWQARCKLDYVRTAKSGRSDEVREGEPVQNWTSSELALDWKDG